MSLRRFALAALASALVSGPVAAATQLLNVSYDPTRELYQAYNAAFIKHWKAQGGEDLTVQQSHGGSGKQARAVIDGLKADVVTLALAGDIDELHKLGAAAGRLAGTPAGQQHPYTSTIVFLVRKGNPKGIKDWGDLTKRKAKSSRRTRRPPAARAGTSSPPGPAKKQYGSDEKAKDYVQALYKHVPVLDTGARGSTITFVNNQIGDVLLAWENEAFPAKKEQGGKNFEIVVLSILPNRRSRWSTRWSRRKAPARSPRPTCNTLYSEEGQRIAAQNFYRPRNQKVAAEFATQFPKLNLVTVDSDFGGWKTAQPKFFNDGGIFDQIYQAQ